MKRLHPYLASAGLLFLCDCPAYALPPDHPEMLDQFKQSIESAPSSEEKEGALGRYHLIRAQVLIEKGRYDEALDALEEGGGRIPEIELAYHKGLVYFLLKRPYEAEAELLTVAYDGPGDARVLKLLGKIYYDRGELGLATEAWRPALLLHPDDKDLAALIEKAAREMIIEEGHERTYSGRFIVQYDGDRHERAGEIVSDILEAAYADIGADFDYYPSGDIPVIIYSKKEFRAVSGHPEWADGVYDGKIRIPLGEIEKGSPALKRLLYHEYTHVVVHSIARRAVPRWLNEGLASYEELRFGADAPLPVDTDLPRFSLEELDRKLAGSDGASAALAYRQSHAFIRYLVDSYGFYRMAEILRELSAGKSLPDAFRKVYQDQDKDLAELFDSFREGFSRQ